MPAKHQFIDVEIPRDLDRTQRARLADLIIDHMINRTEGGLDKNGRKFPGYSEGYINSLDFKIAGKSPGDVNLKLSGDMLASIVVLSDKPGKLRIGFEKGSDENARADGNIRGTYGQPSPGKKKRDFLGIQADELEILIAEVESE